MDAKQMKRAEKLRKRMNEYEFQLPAYTNFIRQIGSTAVLDCNIIEFLEKLINKLQQICSFDNFQEQNKKSNEFNTNDASLIIECKFCSWPTTNGLDLLWHIMNTTHTNSKISRNLYKASSGYNEILQQEQYRLNNNILSKPILGNMISFLFVSISFLNINDRYIHALKRLGLRPNITIVNGVNELLSQIDHFVSNAYCVASIHDFKALLLPLTIWNVTYAYKGKKIVNAIDVINDCNDITNGPMSVKNAFSLPHLASPTTNQHPNARFPITNFNCHPSSQNMALFGSHLANHRINYPETPQQADTVLLQGAALMHIPPPRLPPIVILPNNNTTSQNQLNLQPVLYDPKTPPPIIAPQHKGQPRKGSGLVEPSQLPPLVQQNNKNLIYTEHLKQFLQDPKLESLIDNGNILNEFKKSTLILSEIKSALIEICPDVKVSCFGSKVCGVGYEEDPLNLYVDDGNKTKTAAAIEPLLNKLKAFFLENPDEWLIVNDTRNGIHSYIHVKNHCESVTCWISFTSEIYCYNSRIISYYVRSFPMFQKMCYFIHELVKLLDLPFNQHLVVILVAFYLQTEECLPTVSQLQVDLSEKKISEGWLVNINEKLPSHVKLKDCESDLRKCATGFLNYYGNLFSFAELVVSPHVGIPVKRLDFTPGNESRLPLERYKLFLETVPSDQTTIPRFNATTPMCVQDMLNLSANIAEPITAIEMDRFVEICQILHLQYTNNT